MMATGRGHLRATTAARAGSLAIAAAVLSLVLVSPAVAQQPQPGVTLPVGAATGAAQPAVDATSAAINAAAPPPAAPEPALPPVSGQAQNSAPRLQSQPAANLVRPEPPSQPTAAPQTPEPETVTRLADPATGAAAPELGAPRPAGEPHVPASRRTGPLPRTAETVNGAAGPSLGTPQLLEQAQSLLDPVADTAQSLLGPLSDATQPLLGSLGDVVGASTREAVSLSRRELLGAGVAEAGAPPQAPLSTSTPPDPLSSTLPGAVLGESAGSAVEGSQRAPVLRPHARDVPQWHAATPSRLAFAAPPAPGEGDAPAAGRSAPPSPAGTTAGAGFSGSAPFAPIGLLVLLALATPSLSRFLRTVPAFLRPTPFICALERPG
jgi:hypothetical protein